MPMNSFFFGGGFEVIFVIMFVLIVGIILFTVVRGIGQWHSNNQSPRLSVAATIVAKRTEVTHHHHSNGPEMGSTMSSSTWYHVTFQVESGDRMELQVSGSEYGMLVEGDQGTLTFQGTRYLSFEHS